MSIGAQFVLYVIEIDLKMKEKENEIELLYSAETLSSSLLGECPGLAMETDTRLLSCRAPTIFTLFWTSPLKWWILSPSPGLTRERMKWVSEGNDCRQTQLYYFNLLLLSIASFYCQLNCHKIHCNRSKNVFQQSYKKTPPPLEKFISIKKNHYTQTFLLFIK